MQCWGLLYSGMSISRVSSLTRVSISSLYLWSFSSITSGRRSTIGGFGHFGREWGWELGWEWGFPMLIVSLSPRRLITMLLFFMLFRFSPDLLLL